MPKREDSVPATAMRIEEMIVTVRGERVILDHDLARLYDVTTKALNQAVKRNPGRFPADFVFRLTSPEVTHLRSHTVSPSSSGNRSQCVTGSEKHRNPRFLPYAFTEHGALMAANVLRSARAVEMSVFVVRAFVRLRQLVATNREATTTLRELERRVSDHDEAIRSLVTAIRQLMGSPTPPATKRIGFRVEDAETELSDTAPAQRVIAVMGADRAGASVGSGQAKVNVGNIPEVCERERIEI